MSARALPWLTLTVLWLAGCAVGPDYRRPAALGTNAVPPAFAGAATVTNAGDWKPAEPAANAPRGAWWELFGDTELNRLETLAAVGNQQLTVAAYRATVLTAFQEVEDQLAAQRLLAAQLTAEKAALTAAQHTLEISQNRYRSGLVTYLEVVTAQSAALAGERTVVQLHAERLAASVALTKALGGGWATGTVVR